MEPIRINLFESENPEEWRLGVGVVFINACIYVVGTAEQKIAACSAVRDACIKDCNENYPRDRSKCTNLVDNAISILCKVVSPIDFCYDRAYVAMETTAPPMDLGVAGAVFTGFGCLFFGACMMGIACLSYILMKNNKKSAAPAPSKVVMVSSGTPVSPVTPTTGATTTVTGTTVIGTTAGISAATIPATTTTI